MDFKVKTSKLRLLSDIRTHHNDDPEVACNLRRLEAMLLGNTGRNWTGTKKVRVYGESGELADKWRNEPGDSQVDMVQMAEANVRPILGFTSMAALATCVTQRPDNNISLGRQEKAWLLSCVEEEHKVELSDEHRAIKSLIVRPYAFVVAVHAALYFGLLRGIEVHGIMNGSFCDGASDVLIMWSQLFVVHFLMALLMHFVFKKIFMRPLAFLDDVLLQYHVLPVLGEFALACAWILAATLPCSGMAKMAILALGFTLAALFVNGYLLVIFENIHLKQCFHLLTILVTLPEIGTIVLLTLNYLSLKLVSLITLMF
ncbi:unnamed protein product [Soboliphyme baturini]|uniref:Transmembrane protein n=1 Tax=Soboliphyme baturini TaxID=241478 RepID=A0A183J817_9BILA|nr:unnamed protein product [Soboliphyme baturini]